MCQFIPQGLGGSCSRESSLSAVLLYRIQKAQGILSGLNTIEIALSQDEIHLADFQHRNDWVAVFAGIFRLY